MEKEVLIELKDIYKIYHIGDTEITANNGVNMTIYKGEMVAIVGKSGSGKSTIMNIIGALDTPTSGQYILDGNDVSKLKDDDLAEIRNKMIGFIFQQYNLLPKQSVLDNVGLPLMYARVGDRERKKRCMEALEKVGLDDKYRNLPSQLSGGQQQRASIARALVGRPSLILADEPTGALDSKTSREVLDLLKKLHLEGNTIVLITHDNSIAVEAERVIKISDGVVIFDGDAKEYKNEIKANA
ncbi:peptide ABC transporter ATP-binding protein [Anaerocolumna cellulosilytica]|uniref:Peptide ABC transporter ATP-binding protein n=1 Tax=Anaerocolumna cellulosilytica TaxID=433286 RepID=A0A6S6QYN9_9FIRM|nr:ABC transporter ATP-binding protein [Anaerocolumna cellulosilytica]MBB5196136.1 putative ABC transport system ATP-binding protein [Anaerocolumna cellulosilytica]BCJ92545.1 peptide ABC transporter ATP-binding protein [Anaerocolumna cellulosilytica]